jgi:hypothetical protein
MRLRRLYVRQLPNYNVEWQHKAVLYYEFTCHYSTSVLVLRSYSHLGLWSTWVVSHMVDSELVFSSTPLCLGIQQHPSVFGDPAAPLCVWGSFSTVGCSACPHWVVHVR